MEEDNKDIISTEWESDSKKEDVEDSISETRLNRLYRKLDFRIIPALWTLYFLTSYGGAAYGNSLTMNNNKGHSLPQYLHMTSNQVSTASALDYVGYIIFDLPMNLAMSRLAPHAWMSRIVVSVGLVYACFAALKNGAGAIAIRFFSGTATAGIWPGMAYYISMWYPDHRAISRIGYYYTAAQLSAAVAGLLAAAFQKMDGTRGYTGYQWNFLIYGVITVVVGISLVWWLPDRPTRFSDDSSDINQVTIVTTTTGDAETAGQSDTRVESQGMIESFAARWRRRLRLGTSPLNYEEQRLHFRDMKERLSQQRSWGWRELVPVLLDPRIWPFILMYFGVVGVGFGLETYATTIIQRINPNMNPIDVSLLTAPIWLFDLGAILLVTPFADIFRRHRGLIFSFSCVIIMVGLFVTTFAPNNWSQWGGLLLCGFGLGPTVPITMGWAAAVFYEHHGDLGAAVATALVSGLGNLGSVTTTYALYTGWPSDAADDYLDSNMVMVAILGISIIACISCTLLRYFLGDFGSKTLWEETFLRYFRHSRSTK